jgi:4a-hydroxytetrahydrobiopterin dehydratase
MEPLSEHEIEERLAMLDPGWQREGGAIERDLECEDFAAALALVNRIGAEAERANHHPDIRLHGYRHVRVTLSTHSVGGLTGRDFALARTVDSLAESR